MNKPPKKTSYTAVGVGLGLPIGVALGLTVLDNLAIGVGIGLLFGIAVGSIFDSRKQKK